MEHIPKRLTTCIFFAQSSLALVSSSVKWEQWYPLLRLPWDNWNSMFRSAEMNSCSVNATSISLLPVVKPHLVCHRVPLLRSCIRTTTWWIPRLLVLLVRPGALWQALWDGFSTGMISKVSLRPRSQWQAAHETLNPWCPHPVSFVFWSNKPRRR